MRNSLRHTSLVFSALAALAVTAVGHAQYVSDHIEIERAWPLLAPEPCIQVDSTGSFACKDAGNYESTCAVATCPADYTLTGGGGSCSAGDRKVKSLFPRLSTGEFTITCESQGVDPEAVAICCKF